MSKQHAAGPKGDDAFGKEYVGNVWGPKFTLYGGILIALMTLLMYCEHKRTNTAPGFEKQEHSIDRVFDKDTIQ